MKLAHKVDQWIKNYENRRGVILDLPKREDVILGSGAWNLFHFLKWNDIYQEDRNITDAHIKTALQKVFPNAVFKDKYNY